MSFILYNKCLFFYREILQYQYLLIFFSKYNHYKNCCSYYISYSHIDNHKCLAKLCSPTNKQKK